MRPELLLTMTAQVGAPVAPYHPALSRSIRVYGHMIPWHPAGSAVVRIYLYRYERGKWRSYGYVWAVASDYRTYTMYSTRLSIPAKGRWRLRALHADSRHAESWSAYMYLVVR